jgi:predicted nucleic acid-binding protein
MRYLVDSDVAIAHLRGHRLPEVLNNEDSFAISVITVGELLSGAYRSHRPTETLRAVEAFVFGSTVSILSLSVDAMREYAKTRVDLERQGTRLADLDLLIAATAMAQGLTLLTGNKKHFQRIEGLKVAYA